jgi:transposase-like protein
MKRICVKWKKFGNALLGSAKQSGYQPKCPTCQSTNIKKIGSLERVSSVATLGILSKKINKTFKCNNCGYTW